MTPETYKILQPFESRLAQATVAGWTRLTKAELTVLNSVAKDAVGRELTKPQQNCPHCVLKLLKELDRAYREYVPPKGRRKSKEDQ